MEKINKRWVLAKRPEGMPEDECWKLEEASIKDLDENQILIKVMYLSIDPYMRGRMNDMKSYTCLLYTSPSPRDTVTSRMPSSA